MIIKIIILQHHALILKQRTLTMLDQGTKFGLKNPSETMLAFHEVGLETLEEILQISSHPYDRKSLRTWGINAAAHLVCRTSQTIRRAEDEGKLPPPQQDEKKRRIYTLKDINDMRDFFGTRYQRQINSETIILPVTNFKGGVSKTTTALLLGQKCAMEGLRVLFIDLDPQATMTLLFGYVPDVHLINNDTIASSLVEDTSDIHRVIKKTYFDGIHIIPGNSDLQRIELLLPDNESNNLENLGPPLRRLKKALDLIKSNYDVIILDCGPNLGALTMNAVAASNAMLVPFPPSMPDFGSFVRFAKTLSDLFNKIQPKLEFFRILISKHRGNKAANLLEDKIRAKFGSYMLSSCMSETAEIDNTASSLCSLYEKPAVGNTRTYKRAVDAANKVNGEIINAFKEIWDGQSKHALINNQ
jgi:chromosome partitioning protein